eukprot:266446-Pyramimonas_sp.AAC.1
MALDLVLRQLEVMLPSTKAKHVREWRSWTSSSTCPRSARARHGLLCVHHWLWSATCSRQTPTSASLQRRESSILH